MVAVIQPSAVLAFRSSIFELHLKVPRTFDDARETCRYTCPVTEIDGKGAGLQQQVRTHNQSNAAQGFANALYVHQGCRQYQWEWARSGTIILQYE